MSVSKEELDVIAKLFPDDDGTAAIRGEELSNKLDEIEDEDLPADSEVRTKLKHLFDEEFDASYTKGLLCIVSSWPRHVMVSSCHCIRNATLRNLLLHPMKLDSIRFVTKQIGSASEKQSFWSF